MNKPRLWLADDHVLMAEALKSMLTPHYDVVGIASDGRTLLRAAETLKPDLIVVDIGIAPTERAGRDDAD
jgi:DNA-binding NarL/FixJ family response regulator